MSVRKRKWKTANGVECEAWVVDYVDQSGERRLNTPPPCTAALLCQLVHQPKGRWRPGAADKSGAGAFRAFEHHDNFGCVRAPIPAQ